MVVTGSKGILEEKSIPVSPQKILTEEKQQQSSLVRPTFNASTPLGKFSTTQAQICSPTFTNISAIKKKDDPQPRDVRRMLATPEDFDESFISLSKINNISASASSGKSRESLDKVDPVESGGAAEKLLANNSNISSKTEPDKDKESSNLKQVFSLYI